jgi:hypothetical protein
VKSILQRIGGAIKHVFTWMKDKLQSLWNWLRSLVKIIYREIREGLKVFAHGMKFLFGTREIVTSGNAGELFTKFDLDADSVLINSGMAADQLKAHSEQVSYFGSSLLFSLTLTGRVIHWAIGLATGGSWAEVLIKLAQLFKAQVKEWLDRKGKAPDTGNVAISIAH